MEETLINELVQGMELTMQLKNHLDPLASSPESCDFLIQKILSSYDKALSMLNLVGELHQVAGILGPSSQSSPGSENFDPDLNDQCPRDVYKKRKTLPRWTEQVSVCSETGLVTGDDGYNWRKYGQKDILGANFPRAYYRCTHRGTQGCLATKQVQRSDTNPLIFEITYRGRHTCIQTSQEIPAFASTGKEIPNQNQRNFSPPSIWSPICSRCSCPAEDFGYIENLQNSDSDITEIASAPTSVTNSPIGNLDFSLDFDPNIPFDTSEFFSETAERFTH
ncbi:WRKY family transcription factor [Actinidia rufa]|uniref:WRKY family transcription factor n=1 Tax=Actinidia rufa TaxID=165716 RepID=A0A7J0F0W9_9ERIC|nr:WRKY family transcription factor [Actinidia rufa]